MQTNFDNKNIILFVGNIKTVHIDAVENVGKKINQDFRIALIVDIKTKITLPESYLKKVYYFKRCNAEDNEDIKRNLKEIKSEVAVIYFIFERYVNLYIKILKMIKLKNNPPIEAVEKSINKIEMRKAFFKYDQDITPKYMRVKNKNSVDLVSKKIGFPCMLKPANLSRSRLITVSNNREELKENLKKAFDNIEKIYKREQIKFKPLILAEEMVRGGLYTVDVYIDRNQKIYFTPFMYQITAKDVGINDFHIYARINPSDLKENEINKAKLVVEKGVRALGLKNIIGHFELIKAKSGWKIVEVGPRIGGYRNDMLDLSYNIKHMENYLLLRLEKKPIIKSKLISYTAFFEFFPRKKGRIRSIKGQRKIKKLNSFHSYKIKNKVGAINGLSKDGYLHALFVILKNKNKDVFYRDIEKIGRMVKIEIN